jgi:hypothetical protein
MHSNPLSPQVPASVVSLSKMSNGTRCNPLCTSDLFLHVFVAQNQLLTYLTPAVVASAIIVFVRRYDS